MNKNIHILYDDTDFEIPIVVNILLCKSPPTNDRRLILPESSSCYGASIVIKCLYEEHPKHYVIYCREGDTIDSKKPPNHIRLDSSYECVSLRCIPNIGWVVINNY